MLPAPGPAVHPVASRRLRAAARLPARLHRHVAHLGARAAGARAPPRRARPDAPGHAGGPPLEGAVDDATLADAVERAMDDAGFETAHIAGNSLGGYVALQLAARGRAGSVVALAPAGGWARGDESFKEALRSFHDAAGAAEGRRAARRRDRRHAGGRRRATQLHADELRAHPGRAARPPDRAAPRPATGAPR